MFSSCNFTESLPFEKGKQLPLLLSDGDPRCGIPCRLPANHPLAGSSVGDLPLNRISRDLPLIGEHLLTPPPHSLNRKKERISSQRAVHDGVGLGPDRHGALHPLEFLGEGKGSTPSIWFIPPPGAGHIGGNHEEVEIMPF